MYDLTEFESLLDDKYSDVLFNGGIDETEDIMDFIDFKKVGDQCE